MNKHSLRAAVAALALGSVGVGVDSMVATAQVPGYQVSGNQGLGDQALGKSGLGKWLAGSVESLGFAADRHSGTRLHLAAKPVSGDVSNRRVVARSSDRQAGQVAASDALRDAETGRRRGPEQPCSKQFRPHVQRRRFLARFPGLGRFGMFSVFNGCSIFDWCSVLNGRGFLRADPFESLCDGDVVVLGRRCVR